MTMIKELATGGCGTEWCAPRHIMYIQIRFSSYKQRPIGPIHLTNHITKTVTDPSSSFGI